MQYLQERSVTWYTVLMRGHGESWHTSFYTTTKRMLGEELVAGIRMAKRRERSEVVLVGHSSVLASASTLSTRAMSNFKLSTGRRSTQDRLVRVIGDSG